MGREGRKRLILHASLSASKVFNSSLRGVEAVLNIFHKTGKDTCGKQWLKRASAVVHWDAKSIRKRFSMNPESYIDLWEDVTARIKTFENIDPSQIDAFFTRLQPQAFSEGFLMLTTDSSFIKKWIESHYTGAIRHALEEMYHVPFTIAIEVDPESASSSLPEAPHPAGRTQLAPAAAPRQAEAEAVVLSEPAPERAGAPAPADSMLSGYTFENFVTGTSNNMAYSMAVAVAETPGGQAGFNPLFIYGKSGLGKTHLLRSIQNYIRANYAQQRTVYTDTMELVNDYTDAAASHDQDAFARFKQRYENADVLLIDDVQGLQNRPATLNMVFQIFNRMVDRGKQVVLSADRAPKNIDIDERYRSRFAMGGICDIQPPEPETKLGIIKNYIEECKKTGGGFDIPADVQEFIAENSSSNIRELKSAVTRVVFEVRSGGMKGITVTDARKLLADHFSGGMAKRVRVSDIQAAVERFYGVSHAELVGRKRSANITYARQIAIYLCRTLIDIPFNTIGSEFNRDHSTIMYSYRSVEEKAKESRDVNEELEILRQELLDQ